MAQSISIRELHLNTGKWVRMAADSAEAIMVLDQGRPAARLAPLVEHADQDFSKRRLVPGFETLPSLEIDSAQVLEEDRR